LAIGFEDLPIDLAVVEILKDVTPPHSRCRTDGTIGTKMKLVAFESEARAAIKRGVSLLARTVRTTLGPRGRNVIIEQSFGSPIITKDGVTVAREIELSDQYENVGLKMVREAATKTSDAAGDGTTTATVLAESIFVEGLKVTSAGVNPIELCRGMKKCVENIVAGLEALSSPIKGRKGMAQVAAIAANNDPRIGGLVADALDRVGKDGVVTVEDGNSLDTEIEWVPGMQFDRGYLSSWFVSNSERMESELQNPYVLIHEQKLSSLKRLVPLLTLVLESGRPLLIIAEDIEGEALTGLVINQMQDVLQCCAVKAPGYGDRRRSVLDDIAILTGATTVSEHLGLKLEDLTLEHLGRAGEIVISKEETTIINGHGDEAAIATRITQIDREIEKADSDYDRELLQKRKAKLVGGVAKIMVGGATESEAKQKKMRSEDALEATRAAVEEGVVPGGGVALLRTSDKCRPKGLSRDETAGYEIIKRACRAPLRAIAENAGHPGEVTVQHVLDDGTGNFGFNAATGAYEDLVKRGIIDATKVVRCALENAASVASLLLVSGAVVADVNKKGIANE